MAGRHRVEVEVESTAAPEAVWRLVADHRTWTSWAGFHQASLEREGDPAPDGVGALRRFKRGLVTSREEVVRFDAPHHFAYELRSGLPLRDYHADITLTELPGGGTRIRWASSFDGSFPLVGALIRPGLQRLIAKLARNLATAAQP